MATTTRVASSLAVTENDSFASKAAAKKAAQIASSLAVQPKLAKGVPLLDGYAKAGFDAGQVDLVIGAGRLAQKTGAERKGYDVGVGAAMASADPKTVSVLLASPERPGFDMSTALFNGMRQFPLPDDIKDPIAAFGYWVTHGMAGQPEDVKVGIMQTVMTDSRAKAAAETAIQQRGLWYKLKKFFGLTA